MNSYNAKPSPSNLRRVLVAALAAMAAGFTSASFAADPSQRPNIVFIITDQQSADAMSCQAGEQLLHTPAMDGLAETGMLFTRAYAANPLCMPSRNAMFTGRYPHETGVTKNAGPKGGLDPAQFISIGTRFRKAGYETAYCGKWHLCFPTKASDAHGFTILRSGKGGGHDAGATEAAVEFLAQKHDQPFLLVVSYLNPHNICEWSRRLAGRQQHLSCGEIGDPPPQDQLPPLPDNFAPPQNETDAMALMRRAYQVDSGLFPVSRFTEDDWRKLRWGYYRMIEKVDAEIGRVTEALRAGGLESSTLVVFTSDHGECAGAHRFNQKTVFYEESARVPLIIAGKGRTAPGTTDKLVNTGIDLLPTLLDCAGVEIPPELPGRSLWPVALGQPVAAWRDHVVVENNMSQAGKVDGLTPQMEGRLVRTERYKYCIYSRGTRRESLVDLEADPGETQNLAADPAYRAILLQHRELLAEFGREHDDALVPLLLAGDVKPMPFPAQDREKRSTKQP